MDLISTADPLLRVLGTAHAPQIADVCLPEDVAHHGFRLPAARRFSHRDLTRIHATLTPDRPVVVVCQKGLKLSHGVAAYLRAHGFAARALHGGIQNWDAAGLPQMAEAQAHGPHVLGASAHRGVLLQAWLIRRWIDTAVPLLWVPDDMVPDVADRFDGVAIEATLPAHALIDALGLHAPAVADFLETAETDIAGWPKLLSALLDWHNTPEAATAAALPIIDAAWTAFRKDIA